MESNQLSVSKIKLSVVQEALAKEDKFVRDLVEQGISTIKENRRHLKSISSVITLEKALITKVSKKFPIYFPNLVSKAYVIEKKDLLREDVAKLNINQLIEVVDYYAKIGMRSKLQAFIFTVATFWVGKWILEGLFNYAIKETLGIDLSSFNKKQERMFCRAMFYIVMLYDC